MLRASESEGRLSSFQGKLGLYLKSLAAGGIFEYADDDLFPTRSGFRAPVTVEIHGQAEVGAFSLRRESSSPPSPNRRKIGARTPT